MSIMQIKDVEKLIKRRDTLNIKIEMLEHKNKEIDNTVAKLIEELKTKHNIDVTLDNLQETYDKYKEIYDNECEELEKIINETEAELNGVI